MVDEEESELRSPASSFAAIGGSFWGAKKYTDGVIGVIAMAPADAPVYARIHKLYVAKQARGQGLGSELCVLAERAARDFNADWMMLYTDTRFTEAHRLYERLGYTRLPSEQKRADATNSMGYLYAKMLK